MVSGLVFIKGLLANMLENMPDPRLNQAAWEAMWCEYPVQWKSALRRARRLAGEDPVLAVDVLRASGLEVPEDAADAAEDEERSCIDCGRTFVSLRALASHSRHAHGRRDPAQD